MLDVFKQLIANQFEAAFCTLNTCIDRCPESIWDSPVGTYPLCQVVFHTLFFADYYLGQNEKSLSQQPFHRENQQFFGDYEQLQDREPVSLYEQQPIRLYLEHCRQKAIEVIATETVATLSAQAEFRSRDFTRAELHVYNIRHIQHHSAQLSLRLRLSANQNIPWVGSGWRDV